MADLLAAIGNDFLGTVCLIAFGMLVISFFLTVYRLVLGPSTADRVMALDFLFTLGIAMIGVYVVSTARYLYLDIAIALGLVGFLATVAYARFVYMRWRTREIDNDE